MALAAGRRPPPRARLRLRRAWGTGEDAREKLAGEARLRGIEVAYLDGDSYGGEDDPAAAFAAGTLDVGEWPDDEGRLPKDPPPAEAWEPGWAAGLFPEVLASLSNLTQEAGIGVEAVDTEGFGRALDEMQDAFEHEDATALREAARRAREEARRAVALAGETITSGSGG